jgi:dihydroorotase
LYDLVIKGGMIIDPASSVCEKKDLAITRGKIDDVAQKISDGNSRHVIDARGMIVTPGLIDIHTHTAYGVTRFSIDPMKNCLLKGTTTAVDAGSTGELNFTPFAKYVIKPLEDRMRILAFLNIESLGMIEFIDKPPKHTDQRWPDLLTYRNEAFGPMFVNLKNTVKTIQRDRRKSILGIKWAHHGLKILKLARRAASLANCMLMAESHYIPELFKHLRRGDVATHIFHYALYQVNRRHDGITEDKKRIHPEVFKAKRDGVIFDVGHGKGSFSWDVARLALREGLEPDTISTDLWSGNVNGPVFDLPTTMAKFLHLGMSLEQVIAATTSRPASVIGREKEIGSLKPGMKADIVMLKERQKKTILTDSYGKSERADRALIPVRIIKDGEIVVSLQ